MKLGKATHGSWRRAVWGHLSQAPFREVRSLFAAAGTAMQHLLNLQDGVTQGPPAVWGVDQTLPRPPNGHDHGVTFPMSVNISHLFGWFSTQWSSHVYRSF